MVICMTVGTDSEVQEIIKRRRKDVPLHESFFKSRGQLCPHGCHPTIENFSLSIVVYGGMSGNSTCRTVAFWAFPTVQLLS
jgi:hypothetical protein